MVLKSARLLQYAGGEVSMAVLAKEVPLKVAPAKTLRCSRPYSRS